MTTRTGRPVRAATIAAALAAAAVATAFGAVTPSSAGAQEPSRISVTQSPIAPVTTCTTPDRSLTYSTVSDTATFRLRIRAASPLCSPITATAAIYAMPADGSVWPQRLAETAVFTIADAGITDIVFTKNCTPAQFDVLTGATPAVISPLGERHGPLLFPDTDTAYQDPGIACAPTTTTAPSTTVPATTAAPTTTIAGGSDGTTTTTAAVAVGGTSVTPTTTAKVSVLDTSSTSPSSTSPASLAVTGVSSQSTARTGAVALALGLALVAYSRRRTVSVRMITSAWSVDPNSPFTTR